MKLIRNGIVCFLLFCVICAGIFYVRHVENENENKSEYPVTRVSVIFPHEDDGYWNLIQNSLDKRKEEYRKKYNIDMKYLVPQLNYNIEQMVELIYQETAAKTDVLVVQGNENETYIAALRKAQEMGIQIICVDTDISEFPEHLYIGTDNYQAGKILGEQLVAYSASKDCKTVIISGEKEYLNLEQRLAGFQDAIQGTENIEIIAIAYDHFDGLTSLRLFYEYASTANTIVFLEGVPGTTLDTVYSGKLQEYEYILGFDAVEGVERETLDGVVVQDTDRMGVEVLEQIVHYIQTKKKISDVIYTDSIFVNSSNVKEITR